MFVRETVCLFVSLFLGSLFACLCVRLLFNSVSSFASPFVYLLVCWVSESVSLYFGFLFASLRVCVCL